MIEDTPGEAKATSARAAEEAAAWYARLSNTSITNAELARFFAWRSNSLNDAAYTDVERLGAAARSHADHPAMRALAEEAVRRPREGRLAWAIGWLGARPGWTISLGAAFAAGLIGAILLQSISSAYQTGVGERRVVTLSDGSRIELNTDSRVRVRMTKSERRLTLDRGQAMFAVAHDAARPFTVTAGDASVRALGTRFEVYRREGDVRVILTEGRVQVRKAQAAPVDMRAGQQLDIGKAAPAKPVVVDVAAATEWTEGRLTFRDAPLAQAVAEVNRYSRSRIVLEPGAPSTRLVNGVFDAGDTEAFVSAVSAGLDLDSRRLASGDIALAPRSAL